MYKLKKRGGGDKVHNTLRGIMCKNIMLYIKAVSNLQWKFAFRYDHKVKIIDN